ncbi:MAG: adenosylmethionine--8-amino-7-oxononanoate transaminase [Sulfurovaceae bacterium]|nr:adenosylmethionine--8-amino-7-oxononanoate transaminase [Sulfurovaceae bacterium]MDD5548344.1 adenosylmethionine--8-amino-7-oxononanoate transaminase [Sulfurovaceae bacterium]
MIFSNNELMQKDLEYIWHPCTQMKDHEKIPLIPVKYAKGMYIYDFDGNKYIDAISSWWVNIFGHSNEHINNKIKNQLDLLEHVILAGFTHKPAIDLAEKLVKITPNGLNKVFFADNGSSAVEIALKMSYHYHLNKNSERTLFLSLENSYHGETIGALSVGDVELYKKTYKPLLINCIQTPVPKDQTIQAAKDALVDLEEILEKDGNKIAAFILEPLVQGAGNMHMYHEEYLVGARKLTQKYNIHLIVDEIMTGFGRTGKMFASEYAQIEPDFMTLSKGLTGGYLPLSVVMTTNDVYNAFYCDYSEHKAFLHSHSYTGNTLACAAALATLEIFEEEKTIDKNIALNNYMKQKLKRFDGLKNVKSTRILGMIAVVELSDIDTKERIGLKISEYALYHGVLLRPLGNNIYVMPPFVVTNDEIDVIFDVIFDAVNKLDFAFK